MNAGDPDAPVADMPGWLDPAAWLSLARRADEDDVLRALRVDRCGIEQFAALISPAADAHLEGMAAKAQHLTRHHFGRTISLYVPLYLSNYCTGGCAYCGFASDRDQPRRKMSMGEALSEVRALRDMGFEDILLLTGERCPQADLDYLLEHVKQASEHAHNVSVESFAMSAADYGRLHACGCSGVTLYQETYEPELYARLHRWGPKRDYIFRLDAPARALGAGMRMLGIGCLLGLGDPYFDTLALFRHASELRRRYWRGGVQISFPRICAEKGGYHAAVPVSDRLLARIIFAFRICMPDVPLVLSTREAPAFRDGMAGVGISRMSVASRTSVGGYVHPHDSESSRQFDVSDTRGVREFCEALRGKGLEPVFKNWDTVFQDAAPATD